MEARKYIDQFGGKAGGWFYLRDLGSIDKHLLPLIYLGRNQEISEATKQFPEEFSRHIVRGTHPNDHEGLVDALWTVKNVRFQWLSRENPANSVFNMGDTHSVVLHYLVRLP